MMFHIGFQSNLVITIDRILNAMLEFEKMSFTKAILSVKSPLNLQFIFQYPLQQAIILGTHELTTRSNHHYVAQLCEVSHQYNRFFKSDLLVNIYLFIIHAIIF